MTVFFSTLPSTDLNYKHTHINQILISHNKNIKMIELIKTETRASWKDSKSLYIHKELQYYHYFLDFSLYQLAYTNL